MDDSTRDLLLARRLVEGGAARSIREAAGLSRSELASTVGVTPGAVKWWELGRRRPHGLKGAAYGAVLRELMVAS